MSCCSGRKQDKKILRKYRVHPVPVKRPSVYERPLTEIGEIIGKEMIQCGVCAETFSLNQGKIIGSCVGCDKFLHCGIAGKCIGDDCRYIIHGVEHRATWCLACVPMKYEINQKNNNIDGGCICKKCSVKENICIV